MWGKGGRRRLVGGRVRRILDSQKAISLPSPNGPVEAVWVVERMVDLKEAHFRCTRTGSYARFALTPAQEATFVEAEAGMLPKNIRYRLLRTVAGAPYYRLWLRDAINALPEVVQARSAAASVL
jgi:hypothetical protein